MQADRKARRPSGTGWLGIRVDSAGREKWYCKFYVGGRQVKRALGLKRVRGSKVGLSRREAEAELRRLIEAERTSTAVRERLTVAEAGSRYLLHLEALGRKRSTLMDYESTLRVHLASFF